MSKLKYAIPSLIAAGLVPVSAGAGDGNHISDDKSLVGDIVEHAQSILQLNEYNLAQHRSHQSHQSHASHSSHRSYYMPEVPDPGPDGLNQLSYRAGHLSGRNESSTPRSAVLPSSPMTAKKPRVLKGNNARFAEILTQAQIALMARGYEVGMLSGELNARTVAALYQYQRDQGLAPTGKLSNETLNHLGVVAN